MTDKRIEVAIGALVERRNGRWEVLIARRPEGTVYAGYWELPGGKCHEGEPPETCLVREFAEELGVTVRVGEALPIIEHDYAHGKVRIHPFLCRRDPRSTPRSDPRNIQVAAHRWVGAEELGNYRFPPANSELMRRLRRILSAAEGPSLGGFNPEGAEDTEERGVRD
jgi:8-oxo-dGTP diphosphatase